MRRLVTKLRDLLLGNEKPRNTGNKHTPPRARLTLEPLEDRTLLTASVFGSISGIVFIDSNHNGLHETKEALVPGVSVTLTGTPNTPAGNPAGMPAPSAITVTAKTDKNGGYTLQNIPPGTYNLKAGPGVGLTGPANGITINGIAVAADQVIHKNFGFQGLAPTVVSLRQFLTNSTVTSGFPFGTPSVGPTSVDHLPTVKTKVADFSLTVNGTDKVIDLAGTFTDADFTNSIIRFNTSEGPMSIQLFDKQSPQTVANFFDYITSGAYDNSIFHRLVSGFVLQGGGFKFDNTTHTTTSIPTHSPVPNEHANGISNTKGTISMAQSGTDPNSATNQFFFNLVNNNASHPATGNNLDTLNTKGFTVFGKILGPSDQAMLNTLAGTPVVDGSKGSNTSPFGTVPLKNYSGSTDPNFPTDTTDANYLKINSITTLKRDEFLTYTVTSSNTLVATATLGTNANEFLTVHAGGKGGTANITVTATDRFGGTTTTTFKVTVPNSLPTATVTLNKTNPLTDDVLTATVVGTDANADAITYTYVWKVNGVVRQTTSNTSLTTDTFDLGAANHGDKGHVVTVAVTPNDGTANGVTVAPATAATVINSAPEINSVTLAPAVPGLTDSLVATVDATDADNDTLTYTYTWTINGTTVQTHTAVSNIADTLVLADVTLVTPAPGDQIIVTVTANDGTANSTPLAKSTVINSAPVINSVTLIPPTPAVTASLVATVGATDVNNDSLLYTYIWTINGTTVQTTPATPNLADTLVLADVTLVTPAPGDEVIVTVTANDGRLNSNPLAKSVTLS